MIERGWLTDFANRAGFARFYPHNHLDVARADPTALVTPPKSRYSNSEARPVARAGSCRRKLVYVSIRILFERVSLFVCAIWPGSRKTLSDARSIGEISLFVGERCIFHSKLERQTQSSKGHLSACWRACLFAQPATTLNLTPRANARPQQVAGWPAAAAAQVTYLRARNSLESAPVKY